MHDKKYHVKSQIFSQHILDKRIIPLVYKELLKIERQRTRTPREKWRETWTDNSPLPPRKDSKTALELTKRSLKSLMIREIPVKTTLRYHLSSIRLAKCFKYESTFCW